MLKNRFLDSIPLCKLIVIITILLSACSSPTHIKANQLSADVNKLKETILADISTLLSQDTELDDWVKKEITRQVITPLRNQPNALIFGDDRTTRPISVNFQKAFEQSLLSRVKEGKLSRAIAIIHTPKPTTPLCNPTGEALPETMHPDMNRDVQRFKTITDRTITLRNMAKYGDPVELYIAYPEAGINKRSAREQNLYHSEVQNKNNISLYDKPLSCTKIPAELIGASYLLQTSSGNYLYFGNNGTQAIDGKGNTLWGYWLGELNNPVIVNRYKMIMDYLQSCGVGTELSILPENNTQ